MRRADHQVTASVSTTMTRKKRTAERVGVPSVVSIGCCMRSVAEPIAKSARFAIEMTVRPDDVRRRQGPRSQDHRRAERNADWRVVADAGGNQRFVEGDEEDVAVVENE